MTITAIVTHVQYEGTNIDDQNLELFRRVNAPEAQYVVLESPHYRELIRAAADGRVARAAADMAKKIVGELLDGNPQAVDLYFKIIRDREREKRNADV